MIVALIAFVTSVWLSLYMGFTVHSVRLVPRFTNTLVRARVPGMAGCLLFCRRLHSCTKAMGPVYCSASATDSTRVRLRGAATGRAAGNAGR